VKNPIDIKKMSKTMGKAATVSKIETLSCDAGWRGYYFIKLTTSDGVIGWSEYDESFGPTGVTLTINKFAERVVGQSIHDHEKVFADLFATKRTAGRQGQNIGRPLLRTAWRQNPR
jgi:L-alanine-DL-glutamate epimerase-like enolase superfamily enzyme